MGDQRFSVAIARITLLSGVVCLGFGTWICGTAKAQAQSETATSGNSTPLRFYGGLEYLNWWVKDVPLSVLSYRPAQS